MANELITPEEFLREARATLHTHCVSHGVSKADEAIAWRLILRWLKNARVSADVMPLDK